MKAPLPNNEAARLVALHQYEILDTAAEKAFDDITLLASYICATPIAVISLVEADRQWFKSKVGLTIAETSRDIAFCAHAILQPDLLVVRDALHDARFAASPLVTADPKVRFYAGMPLLAQGGLPLGTLCVYDRQPRELQPEQAEALRALADQVILLLELRRNSAALARAIIERERAQEALQKALEELEWHEAQEIELARQVQAKLFPQKMPPLQTLEYAAVCLQAHVVGGDYYDLLDLGPGRLGLALADIAGKGISAALLMANLQANLRSQYAMVLDDLRQFLCSVNRLFCENTDPNHYATLFFGDYEDSAHRLRFVNCGHPPPLLLRSGGAVERLKGTATVLGLFEQWDCATGEVCLAPGDTLVIFSDGVVEAMRADGEELGDTRLIESVQAHRQLPASSLLEAVVRDVQRFSGAPQEDDLTLVVARSR